VGLTAAGVAAVAVIVIADAVGAHSDDAFSRWTGWATVAAVPLAALAANRCSPMLTSIRSLAGHPALPVPISPM
jgi:hypothetical protein